GHAACHSAEVLTAVTAHPGTMTHHFLWLLYQTEHVSSMSRLTSWRLAARTTASAWRTCWSIGRRRLATGAAVLCQSAFQVLDPRIRLGQLLFQWQQFRYQLFEQAVFFPQGVQFFIFGHSCTLAGSLSFGKSSRSRPK